MTAHFNLAVLADQKDVDINPDAQKPAATTQDAETVSFSDRRADIRPRYPVIVMLKIVIQRGHTLQELLPQPAEENMGLVNRILAGYESDDSWDNDSHTHEHTHTHTT